MIFSTLSEWVNRPLVGDNPISQARLRVQHLVALLNVLVGIPYTLMMVQTDQPLGAAITMAVMVSGPLILFRFSRRGRLEFGGLMLALGLLSGVVTVLWMKGGVPRNSGVWIVLIPVLASTMTTRRSGLVLGLLSVSAVIVFWSLEALGIKLSSSMTTTIAFQMELFDRVVVILSITGLLWTQAGVWNAVVGRLDGLVKDLQLQIQERRRAEQAAVTAAQSRHDFLAMLSHEVRTPLNGVLGITEVLVSQEFTAAERHRMLTVVLESGNMLRRLLDDVLDFSKIDAGEIAIVDEVVSLRPLCDGLIALWKVPSTEKQLTLTLDWTETAPETIICDGTRLSQVVSNLLSNAVKYTLSGSIELCVRSTSQHILMTIENSGGDIDDGDMEKIFEPYRRGVAHSYGASFEGTGLGLSISRRYAEAMGGELTGSFKRGVSTTFTLVLPLKESELSGEAQRLVGQSLALEGCRIMVVEDNEINLLVARQMLVPLGVIVEEAKSGQECIDKCAERAPDLILMDCKMTEMDGLQTTEVLRSQGYKLPIVAATASAMPGDRERFLEVGMNDYLGKPLSQERLRATLLHWLQ